MLFEEKKSNFWLVQYSKGLKFWKETKKCHIARTPYKWLELELESWRASYKPGVKVLGVKALTKEQYDYYKLKGI